MASPIEARNIFVDLSQYRGGPLTVTPTGYPDRAAIAEALRNHPEQKIEGVTVTTGEPLPPTSSGTSVNH